MIDRGEDERHLRLLVERLGGGLDDPDAAETWRRYDRALLEAIAEWSDLVNLADPGAACKLFDACNVSAEDIAAIRAFASGLPIHHEEFLDSIWWARADADLRRVPLAQSLELRVRTSQRWHEFETAYAASIAEIEVDGVFRPAVEVAAAENAVFAIVTAHNPMSFELPEEENMERYAALGELLGSSRRANGRAPDGSWAEESYVCDFDERAIDAAQQFGQAAIYRVTSVAVEVIRLVGSSRHELRRLCERSAG